MELNIFRASAKMREAVSVASAKIGYTY